MYKNITVEENGKPGIWFYCFIFSMVSALVLSTVGILIKAW
jgi:hypothetical protein